MIKWLIRKQVLISRMLFVLVSLAAVRCIIEILRLQRINVDIPANEMRLYLQGAFLATCSVTAMSFIAFYNRYKTNIFLALSTLAALVIMKVTYAS